MKNKKKYFILLLLCLLLLMCIFVFKKKDINTVDIENKNVDTNNKISSISETKTVDSLQLIDSNILLTSLGIEKNEVSDYIGKIPEYNNPKGTLYLAIKPVDKKNELVKKYLEVYVNSLKQKLENKLNDLSLEDTSLEIVKKQLQDEINYLNEMIKEEYKGYYIYVSGTDKSEILKLLKERVK